MFSYNREKQFYKYYSVDAAKAVLRDVRLKWSSPILFNDPFDNQLDFMIEQDVEKLAQQTMESYAKICASEVPVPFYNLEQTIITELIRQALKRSAYSFTEDEKAELLEAARASARKMIERAPEINRDIRKLMFDISIFCVSETHDNSPMWSHYAEQHKGAVVRFLPTVNDSPLSVAQKVRYTDEIPKFTSEELMDSKSLPMTAFTKLTLTKSNQWSYENEWRVVTTMRDKAKQFELLPFSKEELGAIFLGCRMNDADKKEIILLMKRNFPHAEIYEMKRPAGSLNLVYDKVAA